MNFEINGINWTVVYVDAGNRLLTRSDGSRSVAVTDANTKMRICIEFALWGISAQSAIARSMPCNYVFLWYSYTD